MIGRSISPHVVVSGTVVKGFGRGSKELGIPTGRGIYCGFAKVSDGETHKCVETHIMHKFEDDFYGENLKVCITGYLREERNYKCKEDLIEDINGDIKNALAYLGTDIKL